MRTHLSSGLIKIKSFPAYVYTVKGAGRVRLAVIPTHDGVVPTAGYHLVLRPGIEGTCKYS